MCMICNDWKNNKMTSEQLTSNLFEMKEEIGKEHTANIIVMLCGREYGDRFSLSNEKCLEMFKGILSFCKECNEFVTYQN